jgi:hypothetical protein
VLFELEHWAIVHDEPLSKERGAGARRCSGMEELTHIHFMLLLFVGYCIKINFGLWVLQEIYDSSMTN